MKALLLLSLVIVSVTSEDPKKNETEKFVFDGIVSTVKYCMKQKIKMDCFKKKTIERLDVELKSNDSIEITDLITVKKDPQFMAINQYGGTARSLDGAKGEELDKMLNEKLDQYLKSILIQFSFNTERSEGRKKEDKGGSVYMYGALGMASMVSQIFMGKMAMVSGMALLMAKVALMLSIMAGFKKTSGGGEHVVYESSGGGGWKRSSPYINVYGRKIEVPSQLDAPYYQEGKNQLN